MTFIRVTNGVLSARHIVRIWKHREYEGYASIQYVDTEKDGAGYTRAVCRIEELAAIGITADDLAHRPIE